MNRETSRTFKRLASSEIVPVSLLGLPYKAGGRGPDFYDCWGVVIAFYKEAGITIPDPRSSDIDVIRQSGIFDCFQQVDCPDYGDIAVFAKDDGCHVGIVTLSGILNATSAGVCLLPLKRCNIREFYRHRNLVTC
jgi:cell wall-associated NlpC family hydrolase